MNHTAISLCLTKSVSRYLCGTWRQLLLSFAARPISDPDTHRQALQLFIWRLVLFTHLVYFHRSFAGAVCCDLRHSSILIACPYFKCCGRAKCSVSLQNTLRCAAMWTHTVSGCLSHPQTGKLLACTLQDKVKSDVGLNIVEVFQIWDSGCFFWKTYWTCWLGGTTELLEYLINAWNSVCVCVCVCVCVFVQNTSAVPFCSQHVRSYKLQHEAQCKVQNIEEGQDEANFKWLLNICELIKVT
jgi:hypothetical protein